jgi:hypothetical protein
MVPLACISGLKPIFEDPQPQTTKLKCHVPWHFDSSGRADPCDKAFTTNARIGQISIMKTMFYRNSSHPFMRTGTTKPVNFYYVDPSAESVYLVGDFNSWNPTSHPLRRREDGWWFIEVLLKHGHHQYRFLVDDNPALDPKSIGTALNEWNEPVSLVAVS